MIIVEDLTQSVENIGKGSTLEISTELNPEVNDEGFFVVQTMQFQEGMVSARVVDSFGESNNIQKKLIQNHIKNSLKLHLVELLILENSGEFSCNWNNWTCPRFTKSFNWNHWNFSSNSRSNWNGSCWNLCS